MSPVERFAIRLMIAQSVLFAAETVIIHKIGSRLPVMEIAFLRAAAGVVLAAILGRHMGFAILRTRRPLLQLFRGAVAAAYLCVMVYSFGYLPFADATAISYTQAGYIALFSVLILAESVAWSRWAAAAIGIAGALLIAKPSFSSWNSVYLVALLGTSLNGLSFVLNKYLQREDSETTTMLYTNLVPALAYAPALAFTGLPAPDALIWLPGLLFLGPVGVYAGIVAVKYASAAMLGPYTLLRLVIGVAGGVALFHEVPDVFTIVGAATILGGCMLSSGTLSALQPRRAARRFAPAITGS
jgi:drug/metabolite transporter (DMT)-like permease